MDTNQPEHHSSKTLKARKRIVTIEPVIFFFFIWLGNVLSIAEQYIQRRIATDKYNYTLPNTSNASCYINSSSPDFDIQKKVQSEVSQWAMYLNACGTFPPLITTIIIGAWSDIHGRKIAIGLPMLGCILNCLSFVAVISFHLPLEILILGAFLQGALGGYPLLLTGCLSYIADITTEKQRTFRISMVEVTLMIAIASSQLGVGYLIQYEGFLTTVVVLLGLLFTGAIYLSVPYFLLETRHSSGISIAHQLNSIWQDTTLLFRTHTNRRRWRLGILGVLSFILEIVLSGYLTVIVLYVLDEPFCWTSIHIGFFLSASIAFGAFTSTVGARLLPMFLADPWILHICFLSLVASMITVGLAETDVVIYLSALIGCIKVLAPPVVRSLMSKTVTDQEQGVMFSYLSSAVGAAEFVAPLVLNSIYSATVFFDPALVFYISAGIAVLPIILTCMFQLVARSKYDHLIVTGIDDEHIN